VPGEDLSLVVARNTLRGYCIPGADWYEAETEVKPALIKSEAGVTAPEPPAAGWGLWTEHEERRRPVTSTGQTP